MIKDAAAAAASGGITAATQAVTGALLGVVGKIFGKGPSVYDNAGPGVHAWFTAYAPQKFLDWVKTNAPGAFASIDQAKAIYAAWVWDFNRSIVNPNDPNFHGPLTSQAYAAMGIDYPATVAAMNLYGRGYTEAGKKTPDNIKMLPGGGTPQIPLVGVNAAKDIVAGGATTPNDAAVVKKLNSATDGGMDLSKLLPLLL